MPDEHGETRLDKNERAGVTTPDFYVDNELTYLWRYFQEISNGINRRGDGHMLHITWNDIAAWCAATKNSLDPDEVAVIKAMDMIFVEEMNREISDYQIRVQEKAGKK